MNFSTHSRNGNPRITRAPSTPASVRIGGLPLGLAHQVKLVRAVSKGQSLCWDDVAMDTSTPAYRIRREMEAMFAPALRGPNGTATPARKA